jgi:hypothetical protein
MVFSLPESRKLTTRSAGNSHPEVSFALGDTLRTG